MAVTTDHIGFRCPKDIVSAIKKQEEMSGKKRSEILIEMLRASMPSMLISDRAKLPTDSVIYFVWNAQRLLYIGRTENLRQRINSHNRLLQFVAAGEDVKVSWLSASVENLSAFESSLIEELEPELNNTPAGGGKVISFKLTEEQYELLASMQMDDEKSPSLVAKRIILELLDENSSPMQRGNASEDVKEQIDQAIAPLQAQLDELRGKLAA